MCEILHFCLMHHITKNFSDYIHFILPQFLVQVKFSSPFLMTRMLWPRILQPSSHLSSSLVLRSFVTLSLSCNDTCHDLWVNSIKEQRSIQGYLYIIIISSYLIQLVHNFDSRCCSCWLLPAILCRASALRIWRDLEKVFHCFNRNWQIIAFTSLTRINMISAPIAEQICVTTPHEKR